MSANSEPGIPTSWPPEYPAHRAIPVAQAQSLDARATAEFGVPGLVLMEHASKAVAEIAAAVTPSDGWILVVCGPGNNGGDGFGAARFLRAWGRPVRVLQASPKAPSAPDAALQVALAAAAGVPLLEGGPLEALEALLEEAPALLVDALFGVGLTRPLGAPYQELVEALNAADTPLLAVDVPSGMDADTGEPLPVCVQADLTATMVAPKAGFADGAPGAAAAGHVIEVDIGLPWALTRELEC